MKKQRMGSLDRRPRRSSPASGHPATGAPHMSLTVVDTKSSESQEIAMQTSDDTGIQKEAISRRYENVPQNIDKIMGRIFSRRGRKTEKWNVK
jgi:hypothetical protein